MKPWIGVGSDGTPDEYHGDEHHNMEKIQEIKKITDGEGYSAMSGFAVVTDKQTIKLMINNNQQCYENWGYFMSEDDFSEFIGSELIDISLTDTALKEAKLKEHKAKPHDKWFEGNLMFVDIKTTNGVLQFVAYNEHNGYYGHEACVVSQQLNHRETL
jgi:hypothetical protein